MCRVIIIENKINEICPNLLVVSFVLAPKYTQIKSSATTTLKFELVEKKTETLWGPIRLVYRVLKKSNWIYSRMKDAADLTDVKFGLFSLNCRHCGFKKYYRTFNLVLERMVKHILLSQGSEMSKHVKEYPGHEIISTPCDVVQYMNEG